MGALLVTSYFNIILFFSFSSTDGFFFFIRLGCAMKLTKPSTF
jgi:hypothetical protein